MNWTQMPFPASHPALERALAAQGYAEPTPVQAAVLAADAADRDLLVSAQTGSGKTVAFGLAAAPTLLGEAETFERAAEPLALVIAPTRELAMQVNRELAWLYAEAKAAVINCVGGMDARRRASVPERKSGQREANEGVNGDSAEEQREVADRVSKQADRGTSVGRVRAQPQRRGRPVTAWNYEVLTEVYAHAQQPQAPPRESVVDLVRRRLAESDPANRKR